MSLLAVRGLGVRVAAGAATLPVLEDVSFDLDEGELVGLVGESGSGKSLLCLALLGLLPAAARVAAGSALLRGTDLLRLSPARLRERRGRELAMVFQDPASALHPLLPVGTQLAEVLQTHERLGRREALRRAAAALGEVGLSAPEERLRQLPGRLSGGQRQRVMIAMALLCRPALLLADEPTTALDVTVQAQVLELLRALRERHGTAILLVTHDLGVVAGVADRALVLYAGRVVEEAPAAPLFARPAHPYTRGLLACAPRLDDDLARPAAAIPGQPPALEERPPGCAFAPRCALAAPRCAAERPALLPAGDGARRAACHESARLLAGLGAAP